jgi:hypothetical protein
MYKITRAPEPITDSKVDHAYPEYHNETICSMKHVCAESNQAPYRDTVDKASFMVQTVDEDRFPLSSALCCTQLFSLTLLVLRILRTVFVCGQTWTYRVQREPPILTR